MNEMNEWMGHTKSKLRMNWNESVNEWNYGNEESMGHTKMKIRMNWNELNEWRKGWRYMDGWIDGGGEEEIVWLLLINIYF